jgi:hypothetical protein
MWMHRRSSLNYLGSPIDVIMITECIYYQVVPQLFRSSELFFTLVQSSGTLVLNRDVLCQCEYKEECIFVLCKTLDVGAVLYPFCFVLLVFCIAVNSLYEFWYISEGIAKL